MALVAAVILAWIDGKHLADSALFWPVARGLSLSAWITPHSVYKLVYPSQPEDEVRKTYANVEYDHVFLIVLLMLTVVGVVDLIWFYLAEKKRQRLEMEKLELTVYRA